MKTKLYIFVFLLIPILVYSQTVQIQGVVRNKNTGKSLEGVSVFLENTVWGAITDNSGIFHINDIPLGNYQLILKYIGYKTETKSITVVKDFDRLMIELIPVSLWGEEVVVTATRTKTPIKNTPAPIEIIEPHEIERRGTGSLTDVLEGSSSLFLKNYGPVGSLKTISLRGSKADQVLILVDGQRINNAQNGLVDLDMIPANSIDRIEIYRGGNSALYGSDAVGGVIYIYTKKVTQSGTHIGASQSLGTYETTGLDTRTYNYFITQSLDRHYFRFSNQIRKSTGAYLYKDQFNQKQKRENADYDENNWALSSSSFFGGTASLITRLQYMNVERGVPGTSSNPTPETRLFDKIISTMIRLETEWKSIQSQWQFDVQNSKQNYNDPNFGNSEHKNNAVGFSTKFDTPLKFAEGNISLGSDYRNDGIKSTNVLTTHRNYYGVFLVSDLHFPIQWRQKSELILYPALRFDHYTSFEKTVSPKIGAVLKGKHFAEWILRGSIGKNFKAPNLNDLYWTGSAVGNPDLLQERSLNYDIGVAGFYSLNQSATINVEATFFSMRQENRIVWRPINGTIWSPINIGKVESRGLEFGLKGSFFERLIGFKTNFTIQNVLNKEDKSKPTYNKQLLYIPKQQGHFSLWTNWKSVSFEIHRNYLGSRYYTAHNDPFFQLSRHFLDGLTIAINNFRMKKITMKTQLNIENLLNIEYQIINLYPMPKRKYNFTIQMNYNP